MPLRLIMVLDAEHAQGAACREHRPPLLRQPGRIYIFTNASFGALQTGHDQSSGRSSNFFPSLASS